MLYIYIYSVCDYMDKICLRLNQLEFKNEFLRGYSILLLVKELLVMNVSGERVCVLGMKVFKDVLGDGLYFLFI